MHAFFDLQANNNDDNNFVFAHAHESAIVEEKKCSYISTRSTLTPHGSVASSKEVCITWLIDSLSLRISDKFLVPKTFRSVVAANKRVDRP